jgi:CubicO group peptidase (beta-lactamase class C family)
MRKALKVFGVILLVLFVIVAGFVLRIYYKVNHQKDTHDLQARVTRICHKYIADKKCPGLAIGIIQGDKIYVHCFGYADLASPKTVDTNTVFEIGSITKVFTAELTQVLADKGIVKWDETIYDILPSGSQPLINDYTTLLSLATHTSGYPKTPQVLLDNIKDQCNPYRDMKYEDYIGSIKNSTDKKKPDPGHYVYSNMGFSVLATCIETKTGQSYDSLLKGEILNVLEMNHTTLQCLDSGNFACAYDSKGNPACHWDLPAFYAGCGGIRSTISDMIKFLKANMNENPLHKPFTETQQQVYRTGLNGVGKGWDIDKISGIIFGINNDIIWKNGGTGGFKSYIGLVPEKKIGVIILSNQSNEALNSLGPDLLALTAHVSMK